LYFYVTFVFLVKKRKTVEDDCSMICFSAAESDGKKVRDP
jgi:hypothetical protein